VLDMMDVDMQSDNIESAQKNVILCMYTLNWQLRLDELSLAMLGCVNVNWPAGSGEISFHLSLVHEAYKTSLWHFLSHVSTSYPAYPFFCLFFAHSMQQY
jgi:hypothetical protein